MSAIWKQNINLGITRLVLQGEPFTAGLDGQGLPAVWFITDGNLRDVTVLLAVTGEQLPEDVLGEARHLATFTEGRDPMTGGTFVLHAWLLAPGTA